MKLNDYFSQFPERTYKKDEFVIRADDEPTGIYLVKSGYVKMSSTFSNGTETAVNIFKPGSFFPMAWAIGGLPNEYNYQAVSPVKLSKAPKEHFISFLKENPEILYDLTRRVFIGLDGTLFNLKHLLAGNSYNKVAVIIYMLARRFGVQRTNGIEINITLTHQDISHFAGLTRETTTIMVNKLVKNGLLAQDKRKIVVKDLGKLESAFKV